MDKDKILDYVMNSPANTNPNVLKTMLNSGGSGGGTIMVITSDDGTVETLDKTVDEIIQMLSNGSSPFVVSFDVAPGAPYPFINLGYIDKIMFNDRTGNGYSVYVNNKGSELIYTAVRKYNYPSRTGDSE